MNKKDVSIDFKRTFTFFIKKYREEMELFSYYYIDLFTQGVVLNNEHINSIIEFIDITFSRLDTIDDYRFIHLLTDFQEWMMHDALETEQYEICANLLKIDEFLNEAYHI